MTILTVAIINALVFMTKTYKDVKAKKSIGVSANTLLNRFTYEVRKASSVSGTFGISSSSINLVSGATTTIISLDSSKRVVVSVNGISDYLTSSDVTVNSLIFYKLQSTSSKGAIMQFSITNNNISSKTENFETGAITRFNQ